jgi:hypothetical protein
MTAPGIPLPPRRWAIGITLLAALQAAVLHWGVRPPGPPRASPASDIRFAVAPDRDAALALETFPWLTAPTLFAFPSLEGFSGAAWLRYETPTVPQRPLEDSPRWLEVQTEHFGRSLADAVRAATPVPSLVVDRQPVWRESSIPEESPRTGVSEMRVEGPLSSRRLLDPPALPVWPHPDLIADSIVQVVVSAGGRVMSASLVEREGQPSGAPSTPQASRLPAADDAALNIARTRRFAPLAIPRPTPAWAESDILQWGRLVFQWQTVAPAPTNAPAAR